MTAGPFSVGTESAMSITGTRAAPFSQPEGLPMPALSPFLLPVVMLFASNVFMTFAWYAHLRTMNDRPWIVAALAR